jgi:GNAT superfamily N-acetyltransferase
MTSIELMIRPATEADFEVIVDLFGEFALFEKLPGKMINSVEKMKQEKELFNCFVAVDDKDGILGYVTYFFSYHTWSGKCLYMDDLYVREPFRKNGIGKRLLDTVISFAKGNGCYKLRWQVSSWNHNAQGFYKSIGAEIDNVEMNCDLLLS